MSFVSNGVGALALNINRYNFFSIFAEMIEGTYPENTIKDAFACINTDKNVNVKHSTIDRDLQ